MATQDPELRRKFTGKPEYVVNYMMFIAEDLRRIMAELGFRTYREMVGRSDLLEVDVALKKWKDAGIDLCALLSPAVKRNSASEVFCCIPQEHGVLHVLDRKLIELAEPALERGEHVALDLPIRNSDRTTGTMLSHEIAKRYGMDGLPDGTIHLKFTGSAGQSFGAWLSHGVTLELEGDANDYVGKGLSGGTVIVYPPHDSRFRSEENIVIGNVALYGAIAGHGFFRGMAAERFCVRNSGAHVVVEGVGDHGCEYMTGGRVVVLGPTGRNFGAGMSGGIAYVYDNVGDFPSKVNRDLVEVTHLEDPEEILGVRHLIELHRERTGSELGARVLDSWSESVGMIHKVISPPYEAVLALQSERERRGARV